MKTTLDIHDALLAEAKVVAARQQLSLTRLIEEGLRMRMRVRAESAAPARRRRAMPVFRGRGGLAPGLRGVSTRQMLKAADDAA